MRRLLAGLAALFLGLAVVGMVSPTILGLARPYGIRFGLWENAIMVALGVLAAFFASRAKA